MVAPMKAANTRAVYALMGIVLLMCVVTCIMAGVRALQTSLRAPLPVAVEVEPACRIPMGEQV